jgi:hypothetical protein
MMWGFKVIGTSRRGPMICDVAFTCLWPKAHARFPR